MKNPQFLSDLYKTWPKQLPHELIILVKFHTWRSDKNCGIFIICQFLEASTFFPIIWIFISKFVCKIAFFLKNSKHPRRGEGVTVPHCVWKPKMVKNRAQKTSTDFNTYLVNSKPQHKYKKDLWRNLGKKFIF